MTPELGMCWGTLAHCSLIELIEAAGAAGFGWISINPQQYAESGCSEAELRRRLDDTGVVVREVDPVLTWLPGLGPVPGAGLLSYGLDDVVRVANAVGAGSINTAVAFAGDWSLPQIIDSFGDVSARAASADLAVTLEFLPWSRVRDLSTAADVVRATGAANAGVMFDGWHFHRGGASVDELTGDDLALVRGVQLSDATLEPSGDLMTEAISQRLLPGEGVIAFDQLLPRLRAHAPDASIGIECFNTSYADRDAVDVARAARASMQRLLD